MKNTHIITTINKTFIGSTKNCNKTYRFFSIVSKSLVKTLSILPISICFYEYAFNFSNVLYTRFVNNYLDLQENYSPFKNP